jgi:sulfofructose kinase
VANAKIVGLGLCVVDHAYVVDPLDLDEIRTRFTERLVSSGGTIGTALAQAASLGANAHVLSRLGDDADGRFVRRSLKTSGVNTGRLVLSPETTTTVAVVLVERRTGERRFIVPDRRALERGIPDFDLTPIDRGSVLLVDGHFPKQALQAVRQARRVGASVIGDFHRPSPVVRRLLPYVDYPIVPFEFANLFHPGDPRKVVRELAEQYGGTPIVTLGAKGGVYLDEGRVRHFAARRVRVVDTTGAGDVFHGAFAVGLSRGWTIPESIDLAVRAASLCCTALGGSSRLMTRKESFAR